MATLALVALVSASAPFATAAPSPEYPPELLLLGSRWIEEARAQGEPHSDRPWYPEAAAFLEKADAAVQAGRFRVAMFNTETYLEFVVAHSLVDETAALPSDAERKAHILDRTRAFKREGDRAYESFRADLAPLDTSVRSLRSLERALYAADLAILAALTLPDHAAFETEFPKQRGVPFPYVVALVRSSETARVNLVWAREILGTVASVEGLPPRLVESNWTATRAFALEPTEASTQPHLVAYEKELQQTRANGEGILSAALMLAEQRATRESGIMMIFGDAQSRGIDTIRDASRALSRQLENRSMAAPRAWGADGVFTADAMDRAAFALEFASRGDADLGTLVNAWGALDHSGYVTDVLATLSPVQPTVEPSADADPAGGQATPGIGILAVLAGVGLVALRRRRA